VARRMAGGPPGRFHLCDHARLDQPLAPISSPFPYASPSLPVGLALMGFTLVAAPWYSVNLIPSVENLVLAGFGRTAVTFRGAGEGILTWIRIGLPVRDPRAVLGELASHQHLARTQWITRDVRSSLARPSAILAVWPLNMDVSDHHAPIRILNAEEDCPCRYRSGESCVAWKRCFPRFGPDEWVG
jgi:hypothetical protein